MSTQKPISAYESSAEESSDASDDRIEPADVDARDDDVVRRWAAYDAGGVLRDFSEYSKRVQALGGAR